MAQNFSMRSISLNIGNHLKALSMILASRDSSFSFMSSSCLCISLRLWICVSCCFCICCIWLCNFSILVFRFETSSCSFSLACFSSFSFPLPKREATPLVMAVATVVSDLTSSTPSRIGHIIGIMKELSNTSTLNLLYLTYRSTRVERIFHTCQIIVPQLWNVHPTRVE